MADAPVLASDTVQALARRLVDDTAARYPVIDANGVLVGTLARERALDVLLGPRA